MRSCWSLRSSNFSLTVFLVFFSAGAIAQFSLADELLPPKSIELSPYLFPVNPGQPNFLAGTMGELRSTHFHAGIDVRTNNMVGVPILSTQQGYISRIIVGTGGYGNAMFIAHPDGHTSLYGHLDRFKGAIADRILKEQYKRKSFDINIEFDSNQFKINRGDTIGLSGNTGGSSGPHLHFEIRDPNNEALNPLAFGFSEVSDNLAPIAFKVALTTLDVNSRVNNRFGRYEFSLVRSGKTALLPFPIFATGRIGVEILAHDKIDVSQFRCGINHIEMQVDSTRIFTQEISKINFEESSDIVALMDYKSLKTKGSRFNRLYVADGNHLDFYKDVISKGAIAMKDGQRQVLIKLRDNAGNESNIKFSLKADPITNQVPFLEPMLKPVDYDIQENTLILSSKTCANKKPSTAKLFSKDKAEELTPNYFSANKQVYLIDLRKTLPDSVKTCSGLIHFDFKDIVPSGTDYDYYSDLLDIKFKDGNLYDTLYLNTSYDTLSNREKFTIGMLTIPLHNSISVTLKPKKQYKSDSKISVYHIEGKRFEYQGGQWINNRIQFNTHELGEFTLLADTIPPTISRINCNGNSARFRSIDNLSGIASFEANINGEWLLMKYDYKSGILQSEKLDKTKLLKGDFELKVKDRAGNERTYKQRIPQQK
ncbi:MAG: M23 family metallopeptidase [Cyclobacteriaceae bacterium]